MRLKATTLLETIVASLIFLLVFGMAMEALVHIHKINDPDWAAMERGFNEFRDSLVVRSDGTREYSWGTMRWTRKDASDREAPEPTLSENIIKLQIIDNHILYTMQSKSKSF